MLGNKMKFGIQEGRDPSNKSPACHAQFRTTAIKNFFFEKIKYYYLR